MRARFRHEIAPSQTHSKGGKRHRTGVSARPQCCCTGRGETTADAACTEQEGATFRSACGAAPNPHQMERCLETTMMGAPERPWIHGLLCELPERGVGDGCTKPGAGRHSRQSTELWGPFPTLLPTAPCRKRNLKVSGLRTHLWP